MESCRGVMLGDMSSLRPLPEHRASAIEVLRSLAGPLAIRLRGDLDLFSSPKLKAVVEKIAAPGSALLIDLRELAFVDSSGLGALVTALRTVRQRGGTLYLCCPRASFLRRVLEQTGLIRVFAVLDDPAELRPPLSVAG